MNNVTETTERNLQNERPAQLDYILLDASGSMTTKRDDSLNAIDNYVGQLRSEGVNSSVTVSSFTTNVSQGFTFNTVRQSTPDAWSDMRFDQELGHEGGTTPLYDAINCMCQELRQKMPLKCSILIITDGDENASKTTVEQARGLLDWCRANGWQVTFLGADFENSRQAKLLGADESNSVGVAVKRLVDATSLLAEKRAKYGLYGTDMNMSKDEKNEIGGMLPDYSGGK
jgi:von Willebrand factor type A domain-containing protein